MLPGIDIEFQNGNLGTVVPSADKVLGLVANAVAVGATFALDTPYILKGMTSVATLGIIDSVDNHILYKTLKEFYDEAGEGTELWLMGIGRDVKMSEAFIPVGGVAPVHTLLNTANARIRGIITAFNPDNTYVSTIENGLDSDVLDTVVAAQLLAENYTTSKYAPFFVIIEGYNFNGVNTALSDLLLREDNRVGVLLGDTETRSGSTASKSCAIGVIGGRIASNQVQVNIGRVKDGALIPSDIYIVDTKVELFDIESLHDKGYITFRTLQGKSGYFFTDDPLATAISDDYHYLARRRVIDKAYRIAYTVSLNYLLDDVIASNDGTISPFYAKEIEGHIEREIYNQMTVNGELSSDQTNKDDKGCKVVVDLTNNYIATSTLKMILSIKPVGYNRWFDIQLGFSTNG